MSQHIALEIEYEGTRFIGSQRQKVGRSVQTTLEEAVSSVANEEIHVVFSGRTDTGVHATQQVVNFRSTSQRSLDAWIRGTNTYLPDDVAVHASYEVDQDFDARRSAKWRRYLYVFGECDVKPAIGSNLAHWVQHSLDDRNMNRASQALLGEHDFSAFRAAQCQSKSPYRRIHAISVKRMASLVVLDVIANAFLYHMVRNIAGALVAGTEENEHCMERLLASMDRTLGPPTAPATGLYLVQVAYENYPAIGALRLPTILCSSDVLSEFAASDFVDVRTLLA